MWTLTLFFLAVSSVGIGATLMHQSVTSHDLTTPAHYGESVGCKHEAACQQLVTEYQAVDPAQVGQKIYAKAFELTFNDELALAHEAAECAAHLNLGHHGWKVE